MMVTALCEGAVRNQVTPRSAPRSAKVDGGGKSAPHDARAASFAKNGETDGAHEADADWTLVTETRRAKIDAARGGEFEEFSTAKVETGGGEKVLEESAYARA